MKSKHKKSRRKERAMSHFYVLKLNLKLNLKLSFKVGHSEQKSMTIQKLFFYIVKGKAFISKISKYRLNFKSYTYIFFLCIKRSFSIVS